MTINLSLTWMFLIDCLFVLQGNHSEYLSLVSLSTDPPHVCHGAGSTTEASHDQAALTALRALAEIGLDAVAPPGGSIPQTNGQQETGVDP